MSLTNITFNAKQMNMKSVYKYITDNSIFLTHDEFSAMCEVTDESIFNNGGLIGYKEYKLITDEEKDYFIEGRDNCSYVLVTDRDSSIIVIGDSHCNAIRYGGGIGYAIRTGDGKGNSIRACYNIFNDDVELTKRICIGGAIRDGNGEGNASLSSVSQGIAVREGTGKGTSFTNITSTAKGYRYQTPFVELDLLTIPKHLIDNRRNNVAEVISHEDFIERATFEKGTYWIEASNKNIIVTINSKDNVTSIGMRGDLVGSIEARIENHACKDIILTRAGLGYGCAIISGEGKGTCIRVGNGNGDAISMGKIMGAARKIGKGAGTAYKEEESLGGAIIVV